MPRRFDLIAFDWDGTLFDSTGLIVRCIQNACRDVGANVPSHEQAAYVIGLGLRDALLHAAPGFPEERYAELGQAYRRHYVASQHEVVLFPGTLDMLRALKANNHLLAVATGKSRRGLDDAVGTTALHGLFDATRTADETQGKPHPLMLLELMAQLGTSAGSCLMIGDTTHDLQMAANAGVSAVAVSFGAHDPETFAAYQPLYVAHSMAELHAWLAEHG